MDYFEQKSSIFYRLILCIHLAATISGCAAISGLQIGAATATTVSSGLIATNKNLKFSIKRAFIRAKNWASNSNIKRSSDKDLQFAIQQFNQNKFEIAEFYLKKVLVKSPDDLIAIKRLPWVYFYQKRYDKALRAFELTKAQNLKNPDSNIGMGWCYFGLKNYERAIERFNLAEKLGGDPYQIYKGKAFAHLKMDRIASAKEEFSKIYTPSQIENILAWWKGLHEKDSDILIDIIPPTQHKYTLFTMPQEHPRYQSALLGLPKNRGSAIESAWNAYRKNSFRIALEEFEDISVITESPDATNGLAWSYLKNKDIENIPFNLSKARIPHL